MIFYRNGLGFSIFLSFCLISVFFIDFTLQEENLVNTGEFRRKLLSVHEQFAGRDKIRTDNI